MSFGRESEAVPVVVLGCYTFHYSILKITCASNAVPMPISDEAAYIYIYIYKKVKSIPPKQGQNPNAMKKILTAHQ